ncbi:MAG: NAD-dependent epimerase/dehydratase family protein, partial [Thermoplasmata archaeon]
MKVLILGIDGYIGFPLAMHLMKRGHDVYGLDNFITRKRVRNVQSDSILPIPSFSYRNRLIEKKY